MNNKEQKTRDLIDQGVLDAFDEALIRTLNCITRDDVELLETLVQTRNTYISSCNNYRASYVNYTGRSYHGRV